MVDLLIQRSEKELVGSTPKKPEVLVLGYEGIHERQVDGMQAVVKGTTTCLFMVPRLYQYSVGNIPQWAPTHDIWILAQEELKTPDRIRNVLFLPVPKDGVLGEIDTTANLHKKDKDCNPSEIGHLIDDDICKEC